MKTLRFVYGDRLHFAGQDYCYVGTCSGGHILRLVGDTLDQNFSREEIVTASAMPDWEYDRGFYLEGVVGARRASGVNTLNDLPQNERMKTLWKYEICTAFLKLEHEGKANRSDDSIRAALGIIEPAINKLECSRVIDAISTHKSGDKTRAGQFVIIRTMPSPKTLRAYLTKLEDHNLESYALRDNYRNCGNRVPQLEPEIYQLLEDFAKIYVSEKRPTIKMCHLDLTIKLKELNKERASRNLPLLIKPSRKALRKKIFETPEFKRYAARHGLDAARAYYHLVTSAPEALRPGERIEIDAWKVSLAVLLKNTDLYLLLPEKERKESRARWMLCVAIDAATRCILGMVLSPSESSAAALLTLYMVVTDKTKHAIAAGAVTGWDMAATPEAIVTDTGSAFIEANFRSAAISLCNNVSFGPVGSPGMRGKIERLFGTLHQGLLVNFTGSTFENIVAKGSYDPGDRVSLTTDELSRVAVRFVVDAYHNDQHDGLGGETPKNAWDRLTDRYACIPLPGRNKRRAVFGVELTRKVSMRGIRFMNLHYLSEVLGKCILANGLEDVQIRADADDLGAISVLIEGAWHPVPCVDLDVNGVTLETWCAVNADLRRRFSAEAKLSEDVVLEALAAINECAASAEKRIGIDRLGPSPEQLDFAEKEILFGPKLIDKRACLLGSEPTSLDPFGPVIPTGGEVSAPIEPPVDDDLPPTAPRRWSRRK